MCILQNDAWDLRPRASVSRSRVDKTRGYISLGEHVVSPLPRLLAVTSRSRCPASRPVTSRRKYLISQVYKAPGEKGVSGRVLAYREETKSFLVNQAQWAWNSNLAGAICHERTNCFPRSSTCIAICRSLSKCSHWPRNDAYDNKMSTGITPFSKPLDRVLVRKLVLERQRQLESPVRC